MLLGGGVSRLLGLLDEDHAVLGPPGGDLMTPPELARDRPRLDVAHPLEEGVLPALRHERRLAALDRRDRRLREFRGVAIPLIGEPRLDHDLRAVAIRHHVGVRLALLATTGGFDVGEEARARREPLDRSIRFPPALPPQRA